MNSIPTDLPAVMETARGPGARAQTSEPEAFAGVLQTAQKQEASTGQSAKPAVTRSERWAAGNSDEGTRDAAASITSRPPADSTERASAQPMTEASPAAGGKSKREATETSSPENTEPAPLVAEMAALQALLQSQPLTQSPTPALPTGTGQAAGSEPATGVPGTAGALGGLLAALAGQQTPIQAASQGTGAVAPGSLQASGTAGVNLASQSTVAGAQPDPDAGRVSADVASPQATGTGTTASVAGSSIPGQGIPDELTAQAAVLANGSVLLANAQPARAALSSDRLPPTAALPAGEYDAGQVESAAPNAGAQPPVLMAATANTSAGPDAISSGSQPTASKVATVEAGGSGAEGGSAAGPNPHPGIAGRVPVNGTIPSQERPIQAAGDVTRADPVVMAGMRAAGSAPSETPAQGGSDQNAEPSVGVVKALLSAFDGQTEAGSLTAHRSSSAAGTGDGQGTSVSQSGTATGTGGSSHLFTVASSASPQGSLAGQTGSGGGETPGRQTGNVTAAGAASGAAMATVDNGIPSAVGQAIMARLVQAVKSGERQFHLELYPAALGRVQAQLSINAGKLSLVLDVETVQAQQAVQNALPELRQGLEAKGLVLDQCQVGYSGSGQTHGGGHYNSHAHQTPAIPFGRLDRVPSAEKAIETSYRVRSGRSVDLMV